MSVKGFFSALLRVADSIDFGLVLNPYAPTRAVYGKSPPSGGLFAF